MKFGQMSAEQQEAFREALLTVMSVKSQEEHTPSSSSATFMGALVTTNRGTAGLRIPLILFAVGGFLAAFVYVPLMAVANQASLNAFQQITDFFWIRKSLKQSSLMDLTEEVRLSSFPYCFHPCWPSELLPSFAFVF
jgi:hypothetical protein